MGTLTCLEAAATDLNSFCSDETQPACQRCTRSGRLCSGYSYLGPRTKGYDDRRTELMLPVLALDSLPQLNGPDEQRSFQFYQFVTAPHLASDHDSSLWTVMALRLSHTRLSVRHAILAVGSLHEAVAHDGPPIGQDKLSKKQVFALQQYNKAISLLRQQLNEEDQHEPFVPLLLCALFVCMEYMQVNRRHSFMYLLQGRKLLHNSTSLTSSQHDLIRQTIAPVFIRSCLASYVFGALPMPIPDALNPYVEVPAVFRSGYEARDAFYPILDRCLRFRHLYKLNRQRKDQTLATDFSYRASSLDEPEAEVYEDLAVSRAEQQAILSRLSSWHSAFSVLAATKKQDAFLWAPSVILVQMLYHASIIWASTVFAENETDYDAYVGHFSAMLPFCTAYLDVTKSGACKKPLEQSSTMRNTKSNIRTAEWSLPFMKQDENKIDFSFESGVIMFLLFIAAKCRHSGVRNAAVELLFKYSKRQENISSASFTAYLASRWVETEMAAVRISNQYQKPQSRFSQHPDFEPGPAEPPLHYTEGTTARGANNIAVPKADGPNAEPDIAAAQFGIPEQCRISEILVERENGHSMRLIFVRRHNALDNSMEIWDEVVPLNS